MGERDRSAGFQGHRRGCREDFKGRVDKIKWNRGVEMKLSEIVKGLQELERSSVCFSRFVGGAPRIRVIRPMSGHDENPEITDLCYDSREIVSGRPGVLFACVKGEHFDGHEFAKKAFDLGYVAFLCEHELSIEASQIVVPDVRAIMGFVVADRKSVV